MTPVNILIEKEEFEMAQSIFKKLGTLCQGILKAYYLDQKSMEEIAVLFNLGNANAAKVRKFRCMKELSKLMRYETN
ncbi:sigma-70 family RNA polymerase sigma factor [Emticicia sp. BO119]|uniref:sigma-70 family RNA polymerase sigma factor n=1 Tax=Emticicia sp. BO119 TaxID=2757768 RepID=UPI0015EFE103|nr:sigma-70 family RNA polymerase sigma factor [Emticicia sp. BO119]MBA4850562.1 sigma-70 family RNA polymerase sigma factor [Emticicia sp. BO119]